jgi:hypothetical protein
VSISPVKAGQTFRHTDLTVDSHLWAVVTDPTGASVVIANFSTNGRSFDPAHLVPVTTGEHPEITRRCFLRCDKAVAATSADLKAAFVGGALKLGSHNLSPQLLLRVQQGLLASPLTKNNVKAALRAAGLAGVAKSVDS